MAWKDSSESLLQQLTALPRPGRITRRQATYWDVSVSGQEPEGYRIHFRCKREAHFTTQAFHFWSLKTNHPLLLAYTEPKDTLTFHGAVPGPAPVLQALGDLVAHRSEGWRLLNHYLNPLIDPTELLKSGGGVLLRGPRSMVRAAKELLTTFGIDATILEHQPLCPAAKVLLLSPNFVIAETFRAEALAQP